MKRLAVFVLVVAGTFTGCGAPSVGESSGLTAWEAAHVDHGIYATYDRCTYNAFIRHTSPVPCWRYAR